MLHDLEDLERYFVLSKKLGFEGMLILNPKELPLCHQYYSHSEEEVTWAEEMIDLSKEAVAQGEGVVVKDNKFIGLLWLRWLKRFCVSKKLSSRSL